MTENLDSPEQGQHQVPSQDLPGKRLIAAREANGLSREDVASQLRLNVRLITALEEDDYDALPGQTFISGYLRSYARLLDLPEDSFVAPVLDSYQPPLVQPSRKSKEISSSDGIARLATYLIIGVMIASVSMWWLGRQEEIEPQTEQAETEGDGPHAMKRASDLVEDPGFAELQAEQPISEPGDEQAPGLPDTAAMMENETSAQQAPAELAVAAEEKQAEAVEISDRTEPVDQAASVPTVAANSVAPDQPVLPPPPPLTESMPQSKLELRFDADSWTEVKDNAGRELLYRLINEGEVLVVRGEAPFHVFLGYAPGVRVYYNGELFEHSAFQRQDVARFRVGRAEHNQPGFR